MAKSGWDKFLQDTSNFFVDTVEATSSLFRATEPKISAKELTGYTCSFGEPKGDKDFGVSILIAEDGTNRVVCKAKDGRSFDYPLESTLVSKYSKNEPLSEEDQKGILTYAAQKGHIDPMMEAALAGDGALVKAMLENRFPSQALKPYLDLIAVAACIEPSEASLSHTQLILAAEKINAEKDKESVQAIRDNLEKVILIPLIQKRKRDSLEKSEDLSTSRSDSPNSVVQAPGSPKSKDFLEKDEYAEVIEKYKAQVQTAFTKDLDPKASLEILGAAADELKIGMKEVNSNISKQRREEIHDRDLEKLKTKKTKAKGINH